MTKYFSFNRRKARSLISGIIALCLALSFFVPLGFAEDSQSSELPLNYSGFYFEKIALSENTLRLSGIPKTPEFNYIWLQIKSYDGEIVFQGISSARADGSVSYRIGNIPAGEYMVDIFTNSEKYAEYRSTFYNMKILTWTGEGGYFKYGEALELNAEQVAAPIDDQEARNYYLAASSNIQSDSSEIRTMSERIIAESTSDFDKSVAIHDWVCNNIYFNFDAFTGLEPRSDNSALGVLESRLGVCEGFSNLTIALLRAAGIPARRVFGYTPEIGMGGWPEGLFEGSDYTPNHAWLEAWVDGRWMIMDPTWNSGNTYKYGKIECSDGLRGYRYFDIAPEFFAFDHAAMRSQYLQKAGSKQERISLYINNPKMETSEGWKELDSSGTAPLIRNGRTLVPIALIVSEMGGKVTWTPATETTYARVTCDINDHFVQMWINYDKYYIDDKEYVFDVAPQIINSRTMIPLRGLLEPLGCVIGWEANVDGWPGRVTIDYYK